jgi:AcrR family transcriptional regulator
MSVISAKTRRAPRWRRRKEDRPAEIIAAALESFTERGFAATRLDDIAERAGVTRGTLYLYFPGKEELFKAVIRQRIVPVLERGEGMMAAGAAANTSTAELLTQLILSFPDLMLNASVSAIPKLIISEAGNFPDLARFYLDEVIARGRRLIKAILARGVARGEFRAIGEEAFFSIMGPMLVMALWKHSLGRYDTSGVDPHRLCRTHVDLILNGLKAGGR